MMFRFCILIFMFSSTMAFADESLCDSLPISLLRTKYKEVTTDNITTAVRQIFCQGTAHNIDTKLNIPIGDYAIGGSLFYQDSANSCLNTDTFQNEQYARDITYSFLPDKAFELLASCVDKNKLGLFITAKPLDRFKTKLQVIYRKYDSQDKPVPGYDPSISLEPIPDQKWKNATVDCEVGELPKTLYDQPKEFTCTFNHAPDPKNPSDQNLFLFAGYYLTLTVHNEAGAPTDFATIRLEGTRDLRLEWKPTTAMNPVTKKPRTNPNTIQCKLESTTKEQLIAEANQTTYYLENRCPICVKYIEYRSAFCDAIYGTRIRVGHSDDKVLDFTITTGDVTNNGYTCYTTYLAPVQVTSVGYKDIKFPQLSPIELKTLCAKEFNRKLTTSGEVPADKVRFVNDTTPSDPPKAINYHTRTGEGANCQDKKQTSNFSLMSGQSSDRNVGDWDLCWCTYEESQIDKKDPLKDPCPAGNMTKANPGETIECTDAGCNRMANKKAASMSSSLK